MRCDPTLRDEAAKDGAPICVADEKDAGPSTTLRYGRDDSLLGALRRDGNSQLI